jgi:hypothetical protein
LKLVTEDFSVSELRKLVSEGKIALPEFQRDFIWRPRQVADLLRTIARQWPAGTFLLLKMDGATDFAVTPLRGAPSLTTPSLMILDGQQRMTALFHALDEAAREIYYVDMGGVLESGEFDDDHLRFLSKAKFAKEYPTLKVMAESRVIKASSIGDDQQFFEWCRYMPDEVGRQMLDVRTNQLPGFKSYDIPSVVLDKAVPTAALAKIFETINRTGVRLDAFDLMVARLYPHKFKLRDELALALADYPETLAAFDVTGIQILGAVALREHLRQQEIGAKPVTVKGVRQSDVLALEPETVMRDWKPAVMAVDRAIRFLAERCSVIRSMFIPSSTMLLPLADALWAEKRRLGFEQDLERWFWATCFTQTYAQGANTQAVKDARELRAWAIDATRLPSVITSFRLDTDILGDSRSRNEMFLLGLMCLLIKHDARDWITQELIRGTRLPLDVHHIFPELYLANKGIDETDLISNFTVLLSSTNASIRNDPPSEVLKRSQISEPAIRSHEVPVEPMRTNDWAEFIKQRVGPLASLINDRFK